MKKNKNPAQAGLVRGNFFFSDARGRADGITGGRRGWESQKSCMHCTKNMWRQKAKEFRNSKQRYNHLDQAQ